MAEKNYLDIDEFNYEGVKVGSRALNVRSEPSKDADVVKVYPAHSSDFKVIGLIQDEGDIWAQTEDGFCLIAFFE